MKSIFKTISSEFQDLVQHTSVDATKKEKMETLNEKLEEDNKELLLQIGELRANEENLRAKYEKELSMIKEYSNGKDENILI